MQWQECGFAQVFVDFDSWLHVPERQIRLFQGIQFHVGACLAACAAVAVFDRGWDQFLAGSLFVHLVQDAGLGGDDQGKGGTFADSLQELRSGSDEVGMAEHGFFTFGVGDEFRSRMLDLECDDLLLANIHLIVQYLYIRLMCHWQYR